MKKIVLGAVAVLLASWILLPVTGFTTAKISKKEGSAPCTKCHVKPMKGDENLNAVGKCYKEKTEKKDKEILKSCEEKK